MSQSTYKSQFAPSSFERLTAYAQRHVRSIIGLLGLGTVAITMAHYGHALVNEPAPNIPLDTSGSPQHQGADLPKAMHNILDYLLTQYPRSIAVSVGAISIVGLGYAMAHGLRAGKRPISGPMRIATDPSVDAPQDSPGIAAYHMGETMRLYPPEEKVDQTTDLYATDRTIKLHGAPPATPPPAYPLVLTTPPTAAPLPVLPEHLTRG